MDKKRKNNGGDSAGQRRAKKPRKVLDRLTLENKLKKVARPILVVVCTELGLETQKLTVPQMTTRILQQDEEYTYRALALQKVFAKKKRKGLSKYEALESLTISSDEASPRNVKDQSLDDNGELYEEATSNPNSPGVKRNSPVPSDETVSTPQDSDATASASLVGSPNPLPPGLEMLLAQPISSLHALCTANHLSTAGGQWELIGRLMDHNLSKCPPPTTTTATRPRKPRSHHTSALSKHTVPINANGPASEAMNPPDSAISNASSSKDSAISASASQTPPDLEPRDMILYQIHQSLLYAEARFPWIAVEVRGLIDEHGGISMPDVGAGADAGDIGDRAARDEILVEFLKHLTNADEIVPGIAVQVRDLVDEQGRVWKPNSGAGTGTSSSADTGSDDPNDTIFTGDLPCTPDLEDGEESGEEHEKATDHHNEATKAPHQTTYAHAASHASMFSQTPAPKDVGYDGAQPGVSRPSFGGKGVAGKRLPGQKRPPVLETAAAQAEAEGGAVDALDTAAVENEAKGNEDDKEDDEDDDLW